MEENSPAEEAFVELGPKLEKPVSTPLAWKKKSLKEKSSAKLNPRTYFAVVQEPNKTFTKEADKPP